MEYFVETCYNLVRFSSIRIYDFNTVFLVGGKFMKADTEENKSIITFINLESKAEIKLNLDKKMIFIYGKNGSGKTTFSRSTDLNPKYVFNEDFIHKNVYIIDEDGAKTDSNIKNNFSQLLIGEDTIKLKKKQDVINQLLKEINDQYKQLNTLVVNTFNKSKIDIKYNCLSTIIDSELKFDFKRKINEQVENYKSDYELNTNIHNLKELETSLNQIQKQENITILLRKVKNVPILYEYLFSKEYPILGKLNVAIKYIKNNLNTIKTLEKLANEKKVNKKDFEIIESWINLQLETKQENCIFCGSEGISPKIEEWQKIINDKTVQSKNTVLKKLDEIILATKNILDEKELYETIAPITVQNINTFHEIMISTLENINNEIFDDIVYQDILEEKLTEDLEEKIQNIANFLLLDYKDKIIFYNSIIAQFTKDISDLKTAIENNLKQNAEKHAESISKILVALGLDKEITISIDKYSGNIKYSLNVVNSKLSTLSDGQKHKLALAIFLNSLKDIPLENKILVFDDPMVSLDELGYHLFKNYLRRNVLIYKENNPTLIILTHNFNYLYIQISNIITDENFKGMTKILKLNHNGLENIDVDLFKLDDIALFKKALNELKYKEDFILLSKLFVKIFREFLDLKLRIMGNPICENPEIEISKLNIDDTSKCHLKEISNHLCQVSRKKHPSLDGAKDGLKDLQKSTDILDFKDYITEAEIEKIESLSDKGENISADIFSIITEIVAILDNSESKYNELKNYINHPRISYTKNIIASSLDI